MTDTKFYTVVDVYNDSSDKYIGTAFTRNELIKLVGDNNVVTNRNNSLWDIADPDALDSCQGVDETMISFANNKYGNALYADASVLEAGVRIYRTNESFGSTYLIRGVGKKAIRVRDYGFSRINDTYGAEISRDKILMLAAIEANRRGWRNAVVEYGFCNGGRISAHVFNKFMSRQYNLGNNEKGIHLCYVGYTDYYTQEFDY